MEEAAIVAFLDRIGQHRERHLLLGISGKMFALQ